MSTQLIAVIIGGIIGVIGSLSATIVIMIGSNRRRAKAIRAIAKGEVVAIKEKAERYLSGQSTKAGLDASSPMLVAIAPELGFLSEKQAIAFRRAITLDMEMRKEETMDKVKLAVQACEEALRVLSG